MTKDQIRAKIMQQIPGIMLPIKRNDAMQNTLILAEAKAKDRRFSDESITGFGAL